MNRLFQFVTTLMLALALVVPAAAQEGRRQKDKEPKRPVEIPSERKGDPPRGDRNGGNRDRDRGNDNRGNRDRDRDKPNRPNGDV